MNYPIRIHHSEESRKAWTPYCEPHSAVDIQAHVSLAKNRAEGGEMAVSEQLVAPPRAKLAGARKAADAEFRFGAPQRRSIPEQRYGSASRERDHHPTPTGR